MPWEKNFDVGETLDRAMLTFWANGYEATSIQDLVERTGVNRGSLYATYGDKHALFLAALQRYIDWMRDDVLAEIESRFGPRDSIRELFQAFAEGLTTGPDHNGCFVTNTALELAPHDPQVARVVAHVQQQIESFFARKIAEGKDLGEIPDHVEPAESARGLLASLIGLSVLTRSRPEKALLRTIVEEALRRLD